MIIRDNLIQPEADGLLTSDAVKQVMLVLQEEVKKTEVFFEITSEHKE